MKDCLKSMFQLRNELFPQEAVDFCLRKWEKMGNPFPLARLKDFVETDVSNRPKKLSLYYNYTNEFP